MLAKRLSLAGLAIPLIVVTGLNGCAGTPYRAHPEAGQRLPRIKIVALPPPDVKIYELSAGGVTELMDEWSDRGRRHVSEAIKSRLSERGQFVVKDFAPDNADPRLREKYEEVRALIDAVNEAVVLHSYHPQLSFAEKREKFRYSIGPVPELADAVGADALAFVSGVDHISTGGRKALMVFGALVGAATGVHGMPGAGVTRLIISVVEPRTGDVLWLNVAGGAGGTDLRDPDDVGSLAKKLLTGFVAGDQP
jgi:hypothetical protein